MPIANETRHAYHIGRQPLGRLLVIVESQFLSLIPLDPTKPSWRTVIVILVCFSSCGNERRSEDGCGRTSDETDMESNASQSASAALIRFVYYIGRWKTRGSEEELNPQHWVSS